jgi:hypothetical protein
MPKTRETMQLMFDEHVRYEIDHLRGMYRLLVEPDTYNEQLPDLDRKMIDDALIVAFCIHAKNLVEFLSDTPRNDHARAEDYADGYWWKLSHGTMAYELKGKVNNQISHLTYARADDPNEKIGAQERKELVDLIYDQLNRWSKHLKTGYDANRLNLEPLATAKQMEIKTGALGASSHTTSLSATSNHVPSIGLRPKNPN